MTAAKWYFFSIFNLSTLVYQIHRPVFI